MANKEPALKFTVEGVTYVVKLSDFTGIEAREFRDAVGIPASQVFRDPNAVDLDVIAGFIWIERKRREKRLTYNDVAGSLNYGTQLETDFDDGEGTADQDVSPNAEIDAADPEV